MSEQHEDPVAQASASITSYLSLAVMAAEAIAQVHAARAREHAEHDQQAARGLRAERQAAYAHARLAWAPVLDPTLYDRTGVVDAGLVWARAQAWRPDPAADRATELAEQRLRELHPDVMQRYDRLRTQGVEPVDAMRRVAPYFDAAPVRTGQAGPDRAALTESETAQQGSDAEHSLHRAGSAVADDPRTPGVDEHTDAVAVAAPQLLPASSEDTRAQALQAIATRSPAVIAGEGYPTPIHASSTDTAAAAATGQPTAVTSVQHRPVRPATTGPNR